jgi:nitrate reductase gamma subunit
MFGTKTRDADETVQTTERVFRPWAMVAGIIGVVAIVFGVWALIKTGLNTDHFFAPEKEVLGLPYTPALALGEIGFGILMLFAASSRMVGPLMMTILGAGAFAFGVLVVTDTYSSRIQAWTAADDATGWVFIILGAVAVVAAAVLPTVAWRRETITRERAQATQPEPREHWWQPTHQGGARA